MKEWSSLNSNNCIPRWSVPLTLALFYKEISSLSIMPKNPTFKCFQEVRASLCLILHIPTHSIWISCFLVLATKHNSLVIFNEHFFVCKVYDFHSLQFRHESKSDVYVQISFSPKTETVRTGKCRSALHLRV